MEASRKERQRGAFVIARTAAERKQDERERMRARGFVLRQVWVHPKDWPRVQKYLDRVKKRRDA
jgi:hypothetical protein